MAELRVEVGDASLGVDVFKALLAIDMTASMKRAAQALGMPYTTPGTWWRAPRGPWGRGCGGGA